MKYNPVTNRLLLAGDTLDAQIPSGSKIAGLTYRVESSAGVIQQGRIDQYVNFKYEDIVTLPALASGEYHVTLTLVDSAGKPLVSRNDITFLKKDEAKEFARWWNNKIGNVDKVLVPFESLRSSKTPERAKRRSIARGDSTGLTVSACRGRLRPMAAGCFAACTHRRDRRRQ